MSLGISIADMMKRCRCFLKGRGLRSEIHGGRCTMSSFSGQAPQATRRALQGLPFRSESVDFAARDELSPGMVLAMNLDLQYPHLSLLIQSVLGITLQELAARAPAAGYTFFDLERLLAHVQFVNQVQLDEIGEAIVRLHHQQVRGYVATLEAFVALGVLREREAFVVKKLLAPRDALPAPPNSSEMLDTLVECSWGLWLHDRHGNVTPEQPFPTEHGDADFFVTTTNGDRWVDCLSLEPTDGRSDINSYLAARVRGKWGKKFGARPSAASLPAAIAITLLKGQEHVMPALIRDEITNRQYMAPTSLWAACPGLREVWIGLPSWEAGAQRPELLTTWTRP
jgi:hypothetical protein